MFRAFKRNQSVDNLSKPKAIAKKVRNSVGQSKLRFFDSFQSRISQNWKEVRKYIIRNKKDTVSIPPLVQGNNNIVERLDRAEFFNSYFTSVFSLPVASTDERRMSDLEITKPMEDMTFDLHGLQVLLEGFNTSKAAGPDSLPNALLKLSAYYIAPYLKIKFLKSVQYSALHVDWKIASIAPVH